MNADPRAQQRLLALADIDAELVRIAHRRRNLPEDRKIAELQAQRQQRKDAVVAVEIELEDLDRDIRKLEGEAQSLRRSEERDSALLAGGTVGAKQLVELEHELGSLRRRRSLIEDEELELMERREEAQETMEQAQALLDGVVDELAKADADRAQSLKELEVAERQATFDRERMLPEFPADLLALYDKQRAKGGAGAGLLRARRCGACRIEIDSGELDRIASLPADEVVRCDECGAVLVRTMESGL